MDLTLLKTPVGLVPADTPSAEALAKLPTNKALRARVTQARNARFFRKWWLLAQYAFDHWVPGALEDPRWKGVVPEKSFERFRKDLTILAGHFDAHYRVDGSVRIEARSISWARMTEDEFAEFYSRTIDAVLKHILTTYTAEQLERVVDELLARFDR